MQRNILRFDLVGIPYGWDRGGGELASGADPEAWEPIIAAARLFESALRWFPFLTEGDAINNLERSIQLLK